MINFYYENEGHNDPLIASASRSIPDWYKRVPLMFDSDDGASVPSLKHCFPFLEALTVGWLLLTHEDYLVERAPGGLLITSSSGAEIHERPGDETGDMPLPAGYQRVRFSWENKLAIEVPDGYSALFTQPMNRFDTPFITFSAVVDGYYKMPPGNIAFCIRQDFQGLIPAGTPFAQVIPFKTENFSMTEKPGLVHVTRSHFEEIMFSNPSYDDQWRAQKTMYKKDHWKKKRFLLGEEE
jgi:hypothetical protein